MDFRIQHCVQYVHNQVNQYEMQGKYKNQRLDCGIIPVVYGFNQKGTKSRKREHSFRHNGTAQKIGDQITECILMHNNISKQEAWDKAVEMLKLTGVPRVERMMKEYPFQLSGGQRQRVMIAMALVCKPKILIADEPTTALDVTIQAQILDLMENLKQKTGTSILFITHDLGVVAEVCDDVVVMYSGRVVEKGDVRSIFASPSHPYTKGLLASIPKLGECAEELESIPGNVPNPKYMPQGCKFAPRCSCAFDKCREEEPGFYDVGEGHMSRCWLCEKKGGDA